MSRTKHRHFNGARAAAGHTALKLTREAGDTIEFLTPHGERIVVQFEAVCGERVHVRCVAESTTRILRNDMLSRKVPPRRQRQPGQALGSPSAE